MKQYETNFALQEIKFYFDISFSQRYRYEGQLKKQ